jgi:hypothetical protein
MSEQQKGELKPKTGVKIDFGAAVEAVPPRPRVDPVIAKAAVADARDAGFSTRAEPVKIDRRTLRRSGRTEQLNMKLSPQVRQAFQEASIGFATTEAFLVHLLDLHRKSRRLGDTGYLFDSGYPNF